MKLRDTPTFRDAIKRLQVDRAWKTHDRVIRQPSQPGRKAQAQNHKED